MATKISALPNILGSSEIAPRALDACPVCDSAPIDEQAVGIAAPIKPKPLTA